MKATKLTISIVTLFALTLIHAQVPQLLNYQGKLVKDGKAEEGNFTMVFSIYSDSIGTNLLWTDTHNSVTVSKGIFNVLLDVPGSYFAGSGYRYLGVKVGDGAEMRPLFRLTSVPYAQRAGEADGVANNAITSSKIASGQVVKSINTLKDDVTLAEGANVTITKSGSTLTIAAPNAGTGDITSVNAGNGLTGGAQTGNATLNVGQGNGITVSADAVALNTTYTDGRYVNEDQADAVNSSMIQNGQVGNADLAANAVTSDKIQDGTILNQDIHNSAAIDISKISGTAGIEFKTWGSTFYSIAQNNATVLNMGYLTLTAPTNGYVFVTLSGFATFFSDRKTIRIGINTTASSLLDDADVDIGRLDGSGTSRFTQAFNATGVFQVNAGSITFYALAQGNTTFGNGSVNIIPQTMTAIFIPKRY